MEESVGYPRAPFKLSFKFLLWRWAGMAICLPGALAIFGVYAYLALGQARAIWHDSRVWNAGGPEGPVQVGGQVTTRQFVLKSYKLDVEYTTPDGVRHPHELEVETLFGGLEEDVESRVRLSPTNPDDFAINTVVEASTARYFAALFFLVAGGGIAATLGYLAWMVYKQMRRVRRAAQDGVLRLTPLVSRERVFVNGQDTGAEKVVFRVLQPDGAWVNVDYQLGTNGGLLTTSDGSSVLAVVPRADPAQAVLMLTSLYPFVFSPSDAQQLRASLVATRVPQ